ncbi:MAG TPA: 2-dehydropantoate 2-reductase [Thermomicrobiales bacterium]|nr:2-dehydropantoate 2-reductase [Thermomicrobiales bacterium]
MTAPPARIVVYGAGAVGQFVGGALALAGHDVTLLGRPALRDALAGRPLALERAGAVSEAAPVRAVADLADLAGAPDLVLLTVKSYDTTAALPDLRLLAAGGAAVLTLQNGVGNEEALAAALGPAVVRSGALTVSVGAPEPGRVVAYTARGGLGLAPLAGAPHDLAPLLALFAPTGLPLVTARTHRVLKWSKLLLNLLANAQAALLDLPPAALFADPRAFAVERRAFREARAVMRASGIGLVDLPAYPVRALAAAMALPVPLARRLLAPRVGRGRGEKMPSLWLDLTAGKGRSEVAWLNGAVVAWGARVGVATPVNAALARLVAEAAADPAVLAAYRGRPERLLAAMEREARG